MDLIHNVKIYLKRTDSRLKVELKRLLRRYFKIKLIMLFTVSTLKSTSLLKIVFTLSFVFNSFRIQSIPTVSDGIDWISEDKYEVPIAVLVLLSIAYGTISFLAVVGNSLVMWIIATSRRMQNVTNFFIANLALADIVIGLFAIPFQFQAALLQRWILPHFMCSFCPFVQVLSVNVSVFTLTAIAIDRHRAILKPLSARPSKLTAKFIIAGIWFLAGSLATPVAIARRVIMVPDGSNDHLKPFCIHVNLSDRSMFIYSGLLVFLQYLTPLSIISCVYARMALKLWGNKVIKMLIIVVALFAICWLPLQLYNVFQYFYSEINEYRYIHYIWFFFDWLAMSNSCYNPFIYGIYNEKFRREFQQKCPFKSRKWSANPTIDTMDMDKTQSTRASISLRYEWKRTISYPTVPSFYKEFKRTTYLSVNLNSISETKSTLFEMQDLHDPFRVCDMQRKKSQLLKLHKEVPQNI
ncbi:Tachykinin-like peptides receptor 99D [Melipona quadrifasciata]|uniref:Tachykinin-like peptides receptor 99D n=1 Tax=Melipona quadrifasciata TaxID=166423 RepID=A0A0M8ZY33_9HYME|nr:Tachykinin-like peptides receptor 99D [Melipona quadrifasciata]